MSWNYRIVEYEHGAGFGLHEVYYDDDGEPDAMSQHPAGFVGETVDELNEALTMAKRAAERPVLKAPPGWLTDST